MLTHIKHYDEVLYEYSLLFCFVVSWTIIIMSNIASQPASLQGWTDSPDSRGTIDIIWSCICTIFVCVWSVLCVNIGPKGESAFTQMYHKLKLAMLCILGPDFLLYLVVGQWESARMSCRKFKERGINGWSMRHAFYADMGGFVVKTRNGVTWPLDANQLLYLIDEGWIEESTIPSQVVLEEDDIDDRNKQNALVRVFTIVQILWFLISFIARGCQHLAITTIELTTIGFISTTIGVSIFWFNKPADIESRRTIEIDATIPEIHARAGRDHTYHWYDTPLDFVNSEKTYFESAWRYCLNILSAMLMLHDRQSKPIVRRRDDNFPVVSHKGLLIVIACGLFSWGSNFAAWNYEFPTILEKQMWRACSLVLVTAVWIGECYHEILVLKFPDMKRTACDKFAASKWSIVVYEPRQPITQSFANRVERQSKRLLLRLSNISPNGDPSLTIQLRVLLPALVCAALYAIARIYLLVEDLVSFRGQHPDIYKTVDWAGFLPHF